MQVYRNFFMDITVYSRNRLYRTFTEWEVPTDFADPIANYLVYGYKPGSCFTAVLANDFFRAIQSSHPANNVDAFKSLAKWICNVMPIESYGSNTAVKYWVALTDKDRRTILENHRLIYTSKEEVMLILKDEHTVKPFLD